MGIGDALGLYKLFFCVAMVLGMIWMCTAQYSLRRSGRVCRCLHTLNRLCFWGTWAAVFLAICLLFCML